jgi:hypothetical protein
MFGVSAAYEGVKPPSAKTMVKAFINLPMSGSLYFVHVQALQIYLHMNISEQFYGVWLKLTLGAHRDK